MGYQALLFCPDEKTARTVTQVLNDLDFTVDACTEPFAAVKKLMAQHFDAVVVDCDNEQNATLLFKSARNSSSNQSSLAVAVVEGQTGVAKAFRIGANLVLTKPINVEQAKGTLRVARGLLRKGTEPAKAAPVAVAPPAPVAKPVAPAVKPAPPSAPVAAPAPAARKPVAPVVPVSKPAPAPSIPRIAASAPVLDLDDQNSDTILDLDSEPMVPAPAAEAKPATAATPPSAAGTSKFPWQPSPKMAEPMASALRRAAEAAGQVEVADDEPITPAIVPAAPASEKRPMSGAMFQAQGHAAAPARAPEKPQIVAPPPAIEEPAAPSKPSAHITEPPVAKIAVVDSTRDDAPPPTFFPGAYDPEESEGGKTKAIVIVAAVVLLACSAGYLSWKNMGSSKSSASAATASNTTAPSTAAPAVNVPSPESTPARTASPAEQPETTDITLGAAPSGTHTPAPQPANTAKPASKPSAAVSETPAEPEVTQRLIVKSDTRHLESTPAPPQDSEPEQAPSAIGLSTSVDTKSLANLSSAGATATRPAAQLLRVSQGVMEGLVLKRVQPRYPSQALQMRIQGPVQLQATISKTGDIENLKVVSGDSVLSRAALEAVRQWKYKPYYLNGDPVQIETQILVNFKLPN
jgi:periplasmic protein TonB